MARKGTIRFNPPNEVKVDSKQRESRNSQDYARVSDPLVYNTLLEILHVLKKMEMHLKIITEEEINVN